MKTKLFLILGLLGLLVSSLFAQQAVNIVKVGSTAVSTSLPTTDTQGPAAAVTNGWPVINGELGDVTGTFTNATQSTSITTPTSTDGYNTATVSINGTYGTASAVFEMSDDGGITWYATQGIRSDTPVAEPGYTSLTNTTRQWTVSIQGNGAFRVRSTAVASGTANVRISISSAPSAQTTAQIAGISTIGQQAAASSFPVTLSNENVQDLYFTGQAAQTATINNIIPTVAGATATDCTGYSSFYTQIICTGTVSGASAITFEGSNDNTTFVLFGVYLVNYEGSSTGYQAAAITLSSGSTFHIFGGPIQFRYLRCRISTAITGGGSIQAFTALKKSAFSISGSTSVTGSGVFNIGTIAGAITPGTASSSLGKAEDAVAASGDSGVAVWAVRRDAVVSSASASGDYNEITVNKYGALNIASFGVTAKTYRAVANITVAASATDIAILPGNVANSVQVTKVTVSGIQTVVGLVRVSLVKRSTANTGGTTGAITAVPMDSSDAAATSAPLSYTANPTPGTTVGTVDEAYINMSPLASGTIGTAKDFVFGTYGKPIVLSTGSQGLAVNLNGVTVTGGVVTVIYEWVELP